MTTTVTFIEPQTTADIRLTVLLDGVTPIDDCTISAKVFSPRGVQLASGVPAPTDGVGTGTYTLTWLAAWTANAGKAVEGEYLIEALLTRAGRQRTMRYRVPVRFDDVT